ncbi:hypothetical protein TRICI_006841 [Trichomonascus ciferrii]|uniref:Eukaryotic translation initiation factor 3 subunit K n=1 Tax=Trichomonascus ciferrii TaxID=44093 RepID=A0A642UCM0_9ASCO|nr:hypothetical protein TRICI_006841 [Trichomonascus ciferrii]
MENTLVTKPEGRPEQVDSILNSLDRYNVDNIKVLQEYVQKQAQEGGIDIVANLALLKLYQFNNHLAKDDIVVIILSKALVRFYSSDFTTALHLLPGYVTTTVDPQPDSLTDQCQKLLKLYELLDGCKYSEFWQLFKSDDSYEDMVADVNGFADDLRLSIAKTVEVAAKRIPVKVFQNWCNLSDAKFKEWVESNLGWTIKDDSVEVPLNKDNDAKPVITSETVKFEQLNRIIKRAYELKI